MEEETGVAKGQATARKKEEKGTGQHAQHLFPNPPNYSSSHERGQKFSLSSFSTKEWKFPLFYVNKQKISSLLTAAFGLGSSS